MVVTIQQSALKLEHALRQHIDVRLKNSKKIAYIVYQSRRAFSPSTSSQSTDDTSLHYQPSSPLPLDRIFG